MVYYYGDINKDEQGAKILAAQERCLELEQEVVASHVTHATDGWFLCRERPVAKILPIYVISINVCAVDVV